MVEIAKEVPKGVAGKSRGLHNTAKVIIMVKIVSSGNATDKGSLGICTYNSPKSY